MPAAHGFSFPEDWENIRRSMLTRKREQELQVRRKQGVEHQEEHAHQEEGAGAPGQKETGSRTSGGACSPGRGSRSSRSEGNMH
jgi:hypothetical protein